jgi:hypothetical protein
VPRASAPIRVAHPAQPRQAKIASRPGRIALQLLGVLAVGSAVLVNVVDPYSGVTASQYFTVALKPGSDLPSQTVTSSSLAASVERDNFTVVEAPKPTPTPTPTPTVAAAEEPEDKGQAWAPPAGAPDPGSAQAIAFDMVAARGWGTDQYDCLVALWSRESGWRYNAYNAGSGAYGIPQSRRRSRGGWATSRAAMRTRVAPGRTPNPRAGIDSLAP